MTPSEPQTDRCQTWGAYTGRRCELQQGHAGGHHLVVVVEPLTHESVEREAQGIPLTPERLNELHKRERMRWGPDNARGIDLFASVIAEELRDAAVPLPGEAQGIPPSEDRGAHAMSCGCYCHEPTILTEDEPSGGIPLIDVDTERLRYVLWISHGHEGLYGDDGEMQCGQCGADWDYLRGPLPRLIERAYSGIAVAALASESSPAEEGAG